MDIEKLIERLMGHKGALCELLYKKDMEDAATALSTLQAENEKLQAKLEETKSSKVTVIGNDELMDELQAIQAENEKLRDELERVNQEKDAAVSDLETAMAYGGGNLDTCTFCKNGQCYGRGGTKLCNPEWRGPEKED